MLGGAERNCFLSKVKEGAYRVAMRNAVATTTPAVSGTVAAFLERCRGTHREELAKAVLLNKVRVCPTCGKPNGFTLPTCNKCQQDLTEVGTSFTDNLFSAFVLGIEKEPRFPLQLSMRLETSRLMVFDDPLALSPLHFCAIPTTAFIPDWRYLTLRPREGLALSQELVQACNAAAESQFLSDPAWRTSLLATTGFETKDMVMGYNYPPSQNQLHVQYMLPLLIPHQYMMFQRGVHYTAKRFFPVRFVEECLEALASRGTQLDAADLARPIEEFVDVLAAKCGVNYDTEHTAFLKKVDQEQKRLAKWEANNFGGIARCSDTVKRGELLFESFEKKDPEDGRTVSENAVYEREKGILQNYGKSSTEGTVSMGYYTYAKKLDDLDLSYYQLS